LLLYLCIYLWKWIWTLKKGRGRLFLFFFFLKWIKFNRTDHIWRDYLGRLNRLLWLYLLCQRRRVNAWSLQFYCWIRSNTTSYYTYCCWLLRLYLLFFNILATRFPFIFRGGQVFSEHLEAFFWLLGNVAFCENGCYSIRILFCKGLISTRVWKGKEMYLSFLMQWITFLFNYNS
jgi:hypothetical protein